MINWNNIVFTFVMVAMVIIAVFIGIGIEQHRTEQSLNEPLVIKEVTEKYAEIDTNINRQYFEVKICGHTCWNVKSLERPDAGTKVRIYE